MLIGLLLAFIFLGGGHETFLLNPNLAKNVSTYVKDKNRKDKIDKIIKSVAKAQQNFQKETKKGTDKKLVDLNMNRNSTQEQFKEAYSSFYEGLISLQNNFLDSEMVIRSLIKPDEWDSIINKVLKTPEKGKAKKQLASENKKLHDKLISACNRSIPDSAGKVQAKKYVDEYTKRGDSVSAAFLDLNYKYLEKLRLYTAARSEFEQPRANMITLRKNYTESLVNMRFKLIAITPKDKWEGLAKDLNNSFTYMGAGLSK
jgi:hypothetical protein